MEYIYLIRPAREGFARRPRLAESAAMAAHFEYLESKLADGTLIFAGRQTDRHLGIVVFEADSEIEAQDIMNADPAVAGKVVKAELHEFRVALMAEIGD